MATEGGQDPNAQYDEEKARGKDHPALSEADQWGTDLNPVRETPTPWGRLGEGGPGSTGG